MTVSVLGKYITRHVNFAGGFQSCVRLYILPLNPINVHVTNDLRCNKPERRLMGNTGIRNCGTG